MTPNPAVDLVRFALWARRNKAAQRPRPSTLDSMKAMSLRLAFAVAYLVASVAQGQQSVRHNVQPTSGYVPDAVTAIRIAVAVWEPIYGKEQIEKEKPYQATLIDGVWVIKGSLPTGMAGGVAVAEISKQNGTIIRVSHGK